MEEPISFDAAAACAPRRRRCSRPSRLPARPRARPPRAGSTPPAGRAARRSSATSRRTGIAADSTHRDVRRDQARRSTPAAGRGAVLPAHRQAAGPAGHRDRGRLQAGAAPAVRRDRRPRSSARTPWSSGCSPTRASRCGSAPRCPGTAMEVRDVTWTSATARRSPSPARRPTSGYPRRAARRPAAVPAPRGGRAVLEDPRPDRGVLGQAGPARAVRRRHLGARRAPTRCCARDGRELEAAVIVDLPNTTDQRRSTRSSSGCATTAARWPSAGC